jgi:hypothetical protein
VRRPLVPAAAAASLRLLLACLGVGLPPLLLLVATQPVWSGQPAPHPVIDAATSPMGWLGVLVSIGFVVFLCLPYQPYSLALRLLAHSRVPTRLLIGLTALVGIVGLLIYPHFGSDMFDYAAYERLWVVYGDNPLLGLVANHPSDWLLPFVNVPDRTPAYGPLWALLTWPVVRLAADSAAGLVAGYKLVSLGAFAASCWLIWNSVPAARRQRAIVLFAWSPLVTFEALGKLHNDIFIALSLLAVVWLAQRQHASRGLLAAAAGGLVKATTLAAAPPLVVKIFRQEGWRGMAPMSVGAACLAVLTYLPFWDGFGTLAPIWQQTSGLGWSLATLLTVAASSTAEAPVALLVRLGLAIVWVGVCLLLVRRRDSQHPAELAANMAWLLIAALLLLTAAVYGHYFVPVIALAAVAGDRLLERAALWLSIGGLSGYAVGEVGWALDPTWIGTLSYQVVGALVLFGPATLAMLPALARPYGRAKLQVAD